jgi:hypothetical protein
MTQTVEHLLCKCEALSSNQKKKNAGKDAGVKGKEPSYTIGRNIN